MVPRQASVTLREDEPSRRVFKGSTLRLDAATVLKLISASGRERHMLTSGRDSVCTRMFFELHLGDAAGRREVEGVGVAERLRIDAK